MVLAEDKARYIGRGVATGVGVAGGVSGVAEAVGVNWRWRDGGAGNVSVEMGYDKAVLAMCLPLATEAC